MTQPTISFAADISPVFSPYRDQMIWRLDLANYADVRANAQPIQAMITGPNAGMPPAPYPPFPDEFVALFNAWIAQNFPP